MVGGGASPAIEDIVMFISGGRGRFGRGARRHAVPAPPFQ